MTQEEAVVEALRRNGDYLTLGRLYQETTRIPECRWGTRTPFASIRRIVQQSPRIFKNRPGLWGLAERKDHILAQLAIPEGSDRGKIEEFNHAYYQGLLLEIGNFEGFDTYVPRQDTNRKYLSSTLGEVARLKQLHEFTYESVIRRAQTVDVSWFNARRFPSAFFEVEHSTDIYNSLLKFVEFQDFRARMVIVAPESRKRDFESKVGATAFSAIKPMVGFIDYDHVSQWHAAAAQRHVLLEQVGNLTMP